MSNFSEVVLRGQEVAERIKRMSIKEVAEVLNVSEQTIRHHVRNEFPGLMENGKVTMLDQEQITPIKRLIGTGRNDLENIGAVANIKTDLEMESIVMDAFAWLKAKVENQRNQIAILEPKAEIADRLVNSEGLRLVSDFGKIQGTGPGRIFKVLEFMGLIFRGSGGHWEPYACYVDAGYFTVKEAMYTTPNGSTRRNLQMYLTGKGEAWLSRKLETKTA